MLKYAGVEPHFEEQSLTSFVTSRVYASMRDHITKNALSIIEGIGCLWVALSNCTSHTGFIATLLLYVKTHTDQSLAKVAIDYSQLLFDEAADRWEDFTTKSSFTEFCEQAGNDSPTDFVPSLAGEVTSHATALSNRLFEAADAASEKLQNIRDKRATAAKARQHAKETAEVVLKQEVSNTNKKVEESSKPDPKDPELKRAAGIEEKPQWLSAMATGMQNWKMILSNPGFTKISRVLSLIVTLGVFGGDIDVSVGKLKLFSVAAEEKHATASDLLDAIFETIVFFGEGAYQCFKTGSFTPLLYSKPEMVKMEADYIKLLELWEYARNGNLNKFMKMEEADFDKMLSDTVDKFQYLYQTTPNGAEKKLLQSRWAELAKIKAEFASARVRGGLRKAPYVFKVYGQSSVGKSTFTDLMMASLLKANGHAADDDHVITLNADEEYMSNMRSYITGIKIDDYGNTSLQYTEKSPSDWMILICNNIKRCAVMADLQNKGKVTIEPAVVSITTNVEDLLAHTLSNEPVSIGRRAHVHWLLEVKPEFCKRVNGELTHMLDPAKVISKFGSEPDPDIWHVTRREMIIRSTDDGAPQTFYFINDPKLTKVPFYEALEYALSDSKVHFEVQTKVVECNSNIHAKIPWCESCNRPSKVCNCPKGGEDVTKDEKVVEQVCKPAYVQSVPQEEIDELEDELEVALEEERKKQREHDDIFTFKPPEINWEEQHGWYAAEKLSKWLRPRHERYVARIHDDLDVAEKVATKESIKQLKKLEKSKWMQWTNWLPNWMIRTKIVKSMALNRWKRMFKILKWGHIGIFSLIGISTVPLVVVSPALFAGALATTGLTGFASWAICRQSLKETLYQKVLDDRNSMPAVFKDLRETHLNYALTTFACFATAYAAYSVYKKIATLMNVSTQGNLAPDCPEDIRKRDLEANAWAQPEPRRLISVNVTGTSKEDWLRFAKHSYVQLRVPKENGTAMSGAFIVATNTVMIPSHMIPTETVNCKLVGENTMGIFQYERKFVFEPSMAVVIDGTDMALIDVPTVGPRKDNSRLFPNEFEKSPTRARMYELKDNEIRSFELSTKWNFIPNVRVGTRSYPGSYYNLPFASYKGLCMAPIVAVSKQPHILGFHLGGITGTPQGCGGAITLQMYQTALNKLHRSDFSMQSIEARDLDKEQMGINFYESDEIHHKSPTRFIGEKPALEVYGTVKGRQKFDSNVVKTEISDTVTEITGVKNSWGPPAFAGSDPTRTQRWQPWQASLEYASQPSVGFAPSLVKKASTDYLIELRATYKKQQDFWKDEIRPLTSEETINGISGKRFIDRMVEKTSMGYPVGGPKSKWLEEILPGTEGLVIKEFKPEVMKEVARMMSYAKEGKSLNAIFLASLKDEPTKIDKTKVRVFQASPVALQYLIRMYYLPIARFLSINPLVAECAVGINATGPEWEQLSDHITKFGKNRILAGDYSKYDLRMPAQLTLEAFKVLMEIASWTGNYTEEDFTVMKAIAMDVCYPLIAYNGDLLRFFGTNPSGQNLTVYINSIVNSLLFRMGFFSMYPQRFFGTFRSAVALATYGDDAKSSVKKGYEKFNHISFAKFLADNDMKFTMPDKESTPTEYMTDEDADFLKRKNKYIEELGHHVGCLEEASIFKSLHSILESKVCTNIDVCEQNVDGALYEWFFHGREVYEQRREQMKQVAQRHDLHCRSLDMTFDHRVQQWKEKYEEQSGESDDSFGDCVQDESELNQLDVTIFQEKTLQAQAIAACPWKITFQEYSLLDLGKGDLIFRKIVPGGSPCIFVVEVKALTYNGFALPGKYRRAKLNKLNKQARKYGKVVKLLQPTAIVIVAIYSEEGFALVPGFDEEQIPEELKSLM